MADKADITMLLNEWRGYSAYEMAVRNGYEGTEAEWLESLKGRDGGMASVNGIAHGKDGNVTLRSGDIAVSEADGRTLDEIVRAVDGLTEAIEATGSGIDLGGKYIDNALFR